MSEKANATENLFEYLNEKFGKNIVLSFLVLALVVIAYLYQQNASCEQSQIEQQKDFTIELAKSKDDMIQYLQGIKAEVKAVKEQTEAVEDESQQTEKQLKKIKKDLQ